MPFWRGCVVCSIAKFENSVKIGTQLFPWAILVETMHLKEFDLTSWEDVFSTPATIVPYSGLLDVVSLTGRFDARRANLGRRDCPGRLHQSG